MYVLLIEFCFSFDGSSVSLAIEQETVNLSAWGISANGNTSVLQAEVKGSIPLSSTIFIGKELLCRSISKIIRELLELITASDLQCIG